MNRINNAELGSDASPGGNEMQNVIAALEQLQNAPVEQPQNEYQLEELMTNLDKEDLVPPTRLCYQIEALSQ
ncbi:hypothetical protein R1flu_009086 [Riccia fluitans]|uniref:Uncharacterized protein n=1 Tax=Riccia fluitans TaxID=41844 RepID=A0ABD1Z291_9MARC